MPKDTKPKKSKAGATKAKSVKLKDLPKLPEEDLKSIKGGTKTLRQG